METLPSVGDHANAVGSERSRRRTYDCDANPEVLLT